MSSSSSSSSAGGIGFFGVLQIVFITLKLLGKIDWSWPVVFLPVEFVGVVIVLFFIGAVVAIIRGALKDN